MAQPRILLDHSVENGLLISDDFGAPSLTCRWRTCRTLVGGRTGGGQAGGGDAGGGSSIVSSAWNDVSSSSTFFEVLGWARNLTDTSNAKMQMMKYLQRVHRSLLLGASRVRNDPLYCLTRFGELFASLILHMHHDIIGWKRSSACYTSCWYRGLSKKVLCSSRHNVYLSWVHMVRQEGKHPSGWSVRYLVLAILTCRVNNVHHLVMTRLLPLT